MSIFNRDNRNDKPAEILPPHAPQPNTVPLNMAQPKAASQTIEQPAKSAFAPAEIVPPKPTPTPAKAGATMASVISKALKITGELESTEDIQIDGQIEGDVRGVGVKIGQNAKVKGTVYGEEVELAGTVEGKIESKRVTLTGTARMTGDIWHQDIKIESGAYINGNLKPELGKADSKPAVKAPNATASILSPANKDSVTGAVHHY